MVLAAGSSQVSHSVSFRRAVGKLSFFLSLSFLLLLIFLRLRRRHQQSFSYSQYIIQIYSSVFRVSIDPFCALITQQGHLFISLSQSLTGRKEVAVCAVCLRVCSCCYIRASKQTHNNNNNSFLSFFFCCCCCCFCACLHAPVGLTRASSFPWWHARDSLLASLISHGSYIVFVLTCYSIVVILICHTPPKEMMIMTTMQQRNNTNIVDL